MRGCTNLAAAVYTVLYDRHAKRVRAGLEVPHQLAASYRSAQSPGFEESESMMDSVGLTWGW